MAVKSISLIKCALLCTSSTVVLLLATPVGAQIADRPTNAAPVAAGEPASDTASVPEGAPRAASAADRDDKEIIVTARRREERLQDVPVSVTVVSGQALAEANITSVQDIQQKVPGMTIIPTAFGTNVLAPAMRGHRQFNSYIANDPAVAVYFADVVQSRAQGLNSALYDLESVQVLKGPQGTLFGRNTTGGAMIITPVAPRNEFEGYVTGAVGNYDHRRLEGALNVPITPTLAVRAAGSLIRREGYTRNYTTGQRLDDQHKDSFRVSARWTPSDRFENRLVANWFKADENGTGYKLLSLNLPVLAASATIPLAIQRGVTVQQFVADLARQKSLPFHSTTSDLINRTDISTFSLSNITELGVGEATIRNIFGYRTVEAFTNFDLDGSVSNFFPSLEQMHAKQVSEELQLLGTAFDKSLDYIVGGFFFRETGSDFQNSNAVIGNRRTFADPVTNRSHSVFGQVTYRPPFLSGVGLTGGVRQTWDRRSLTARSFDTSPFNGITSCRLTDNGIPRNPCERDLSAKFSKLTYTLSADWKITPDVLVYAAHRQGYRSGGFNFGGGSLATFGPFRPEVVKDIELGLKSEFTVGDMRGRFNIAAYDQDYKDIQRSVGYFIDTANGRAFVNATTNAANATVRGFEGEFELRPVRNLDLGVGVAHIDAKYKGFFDFAANGSSVDVSESAFAGAPKWAVSANAALTLPLLGDAGEVLVRGDMYYQSKTNWTDSNFDPAINAVDPDTFSAPYTLFNGRIEWREMFGRPVSLAIFGRNLTDKEYIVGGNWGRRSQGYTAVFAGEPRTYGLEATFRF